MTAYLLNSRVMIALVVWDYYHNNGRAHLDNLIQFLNKNSSVNQSQSQKDNSRQKNYLNIGSRSVVRKRDDLRIPQIHPQRWRHLLQRVDELLGHSIVPTLHN